MNVGTYTVLTVGGSALDPVPTSEYPHPRRPRRR
jgi:hypothetical protein